MKSQSAKLVSTIRLNFVFMGILTGGWSTRIPELKNALHMSDAVLGRTLIGGSLGALVTSRIIGRLINDLGTKKVFILGSLIFPIGYFLVAFAPNPFFVFLGIFFFMIGYLFLDNPLTIITQGLEAKDDRKYLSGFHAFWSIGTLLAGFFGSFLIGRIHYSTHLAGLGILSFSVLILSARKLENKKPDSTPKDLVKIPWFNSLGKFVIVIAIGMLFSNGAEFGATDWSALFLRDVLAITGSAYVGAYIAFEIGMIISRLAADKFIHTYGAARVIQISATLGSLVWLGTMFAGINLESAHKGLAYATVLLGYLVAGAGVGPLFPGFITILGASAGDQMGSALSRAFMIAMLGVAVIPATIGYISDSTSLTIGMLLPITLLLSAGFLARRAKVK